MGCIVTLPKRYYKKLESFGIKCHSFNKFIPVLNSKLNCRDHRKIVVIDGKVGFTGGINLADEYINKKQRFGHWKDNGIMLKGDAVWSLTVMFLQAWIFSTNEEVEFKNYYPHINEDNSITFYHPTVYINCSEDNKHFYSKDGKLYNKKTDELISNFSYSK